MFKYQWKRTARLLHSAEPAVFPEVGLQGSGLGGANDRMTSLATSQSHRAHHACCSGWPTRGLQFPKNLAFRIESSL